MTALLVREGALTLEVPRQYPAQLRSLVLLSRRGRGDRAMTSDPEYRGVWFAFLLWLRDTAPGLPAWFHPSHWERRRSQKRSARCFFCFGRLLDCVGLMPPPVLILVPASAKLLVTLPSAEHAPRTQEKPLVKLVP